MGASESRLMVRDKYRTILGRNRYSQTLRDYCYTKYRDGSYYSDCSSSICYTYKECGLSFGILNTVGMWQSPKLVDVPVEIKKGVIQNPEILRIGDMLLFAGNDSSRKYAGYVGHVEMVGEISGKTVQLYGHGSGNPKRHEMNAYCRTRYATKSTTPLGHRGLIRVRRFIRDDDPQTPTRAIRITGDTVNIRKAPTTAAPIVAVARKGERFPCTDTTENGWHAITFNGSTAYVSGKYSEPCP